MQPAGFVSVAGASVRGPSRRSRAARTLGPRARVRLAAATRAARGGHLLVPAAQSAPSAHGGRRGGALRIRLLYKYTTVCFSSTVNTSYTRFSFTTPPPLFDIGSPRGFEYNSSRPAFAVGSFH